jgi:hypothetical protein
MTNHKYDPHCQCLDCLREHLILINTAHKATPPKAFYAITLPATPAAKATIRPSTNNNTVR